MPKLLSCLWQVAFFCIVCNATAQDRVFSGKVTDGSGKGLAGVTVTVKSTGTGNYTDDAGAFTVTAPKNSDTLIFSTVGYAELRRLATVGVFLTVELTATDKSMEEVVIVGYGTQKKINLTGAVAQVDGKVLANRPVSNVGQALQGTVGNLNITPSSDGGGPGAGVNFNIRGATSLSSGGAPFYIVDGVPVENISNLNPADIQSISVLKDAAASAIYGARAAYGVILVTTKTGKTGKATISYGNIFGFSRATQIPNQVNSLEFAEAYNIASVNAGQSPMFSQEHIDRIKAYMADPANTPSNIPNPNNPDFWSYATLDNDNVDWIRAYFKPGTENQKHDLSVSGGGDKTSYYIGAGYFREGGLLRYGNEKYERFNVTSNLHFTPLKWLRGDLRTRFSRDNRNVPSPTHNGDIGNWMHLATTRFPNWALKDPNGHWAATSNMPRQWEGRGLSNNNVVNLTGAIEIEPVKNWKINVDYTYRNTAFKSSAHAKPFIWEYTVSEVPVMTTNNAYSTEMSQLNYNSLNAYTSYSNQLGQHSFSALVGQQAELSKYTYLFGMKRDLISQDLPSLGVATGDQTTNGSLTHWANTGTFMRVNYNFGERYLVEFNARYDGSSKFPQGRQFGFFPSVSAGYNIAKEKFWTIRDITQLKLRGSYGSLGNQDVANYLYLSTIGIGTKYGYILNGVLPNYLTAPGLVSANLTWETARTVDLGLDVTLLSNRLNVSFDWYTRTTTNMFGPANALPSTLGANIPLQNNADLRTRGFELNLGWRDHIGRDFTYNVNLILSDNKAKVIRYNNPTKILSTYYEGQTLGEIWGYTTEGIMQTDDQVSKMADQSFFWGNWGKGDIAYRDLNGDGKINNGKNTLDDRGDLSVIGNSLPRYSYSVALGASWKGFDLNVFFQGVGKRDFSPPSGGNSGVFFWGFTSGFGSNMYKETSDFWTPDNTDAYLPKPYNSGEVGKNQVTQTRYLQNAAYLRLKNLQLGYSIPPAVMQRIGLQRIRLFLSGENLFTITSLQKNFDPELTAGGWGAGKVYPLYKIVSFGVNVDF
ncbi:MAG: SusC/RagA family TonB-linked outer membrane protein [Agriterribacter sp.]